MTSALLLCFIFSLSYAHPWQCSQSIKEVVCAFKHKKLLNPPPIFKLDPYTNQTVKSTAKLEETLQDRSTVCALKFMDKSQVSYVLMQFGSRESAEEHGFLVTHQGRCGACSTLQDLSVYLWSPDLTNPVRRCALKGIIYSRWALNCLKKLGFSSSCAQIWLYNTGNTRRECFSVCIKAWLRGEANNAPGAKLNKCLQCDEDKSGPVFKYFAGRTRRNSGIYSAINRSPEEIYKMNHCYY